MAAAWTRSSEAVHQQDSEACQESFGQVKAPPKKRKAVVWVESAETQDDVSARPWTSRMEQGMETENEEDMEELSFLPSAVSEPRWALQICANKCRAKGLKFLEISANVSDAQRTRVTRDVLQ